LQFNALGREIIPSWLYKQSNSKLDLGDIDKGWACVAANAVKKAAADYARELGKGLSKDEAMERCSQSRFIAAKLHTIGYVSLIRRGNDSHLLT
jgi:acyl-CoA oxidase